MTVAYSVILRQRLKDEIYISPNSMAASYVTKGIKIELKYRNTYAYVQALPTRLKREYDVRIYKNTKRIILPIFFPNIAQYSTYILDGDLS